MKLSYLANARIPTEKAHGVQIMKMCEAFSDAEVQVELIIPRRFNLIQDNPFSFYGVRKNFKIRRLPCLDLVKFGKLGFCIQSVTFAVSSFFYVIFKKSDIIYSRDELPLYFLSFLKNKKLFWETHIAKESFVVKKLFKKNASVVSITKGLKNFYIEKYNPNLEKIFVAPDAVDLKDFDIKIEKDKLRRDLELPKNKKIILYSGHLYDWKGAQTLADSSKFFKNDELLVFLGGSDKDIENFKNKNKDKKNILILGRVLHSQVSFYLKSADVLVLPNSAKREISKFYTSPMKLFEYMASGVPIVASKLPSIEEILTDGVNAVLVEPDNDIKLFEGVKILLQDNIFKEKISKKAFSDIKKYTWKKRVENILRFVNI